MKNTYLKKRFEAWIIDFIPYIIVLMVLFAVGLGGGLSNSGPTATVQLVFYTSIFISLIIIVVQGFFYFRDGQTIGYKIVKLKIISVKENEDKKIVYRNLLFRFWLKYGAVLFGLCFLFPLCIIYLLVELYFIFFKGDDLYDKFTKLKIISLEGGVKNLESKI